MIKLLPFDLEKALQGHPVITVDGNKSIAIRYIKEKEGEKVLCVFRHKSNIHAYFIAFYFDDGKYDLNERSDNNDLFMVEEEPIKLEVGKFYKNRKGEKCYVFYVYPEGKMCCYVPFGFPFCLSISINGKVFPDECIDDPKDMIEEWKD